MERGEPTFVPEWYKGASGGAVSSSNHTRTSSHSDEHGGIGLLSRNKLSVSVCDHDAPRSLAFRDRSPSSFRRSVSSNGSINHDKSSAAHSRPYSSFGRNQRDRDRGKDVDLTDRGRSLSIDNGFCDYSDSFKKTRTEKDNLRRSTSMISGRPVESSSRRTGKDLSNGVHSGGFVVAGSSKFSLEKDFPSLGGEEKLGLSDVSRIASPGLSTAIQSLPIGSSTIGGEGWTSALVEIPVKVGGNGPVVSPALQAAALSSTSNALNATTGLNMAEALAQPSRGRNAPQLSIDTERRKELSRIDYAKLIPVTPSTTKSSVLNSDKSKPKVAKGGGDLCATAPFKVGSQVVGQPLRQPNNPKVGSQHGNFQVLNRERNGTSPSSKDRPNLMIASGVATPLSGVPPSVVPPSVKFEVKGGGGALSNFAEKRPPFQAQNRKDFFNSIRNKSSGNHHSACVPDPCVVIAPPPDSDCKSGNGTPRVSSSGSMENGDFVIGETGKLMPDGDTKEEEGSMENGEFVIGETGKLMPDGDTKEEQGSCSESVVVDPDEEEAAFLKSLGWEENAGEEALTAEEIDAFVKEYEKLRPSSKLCPRDDAR